MSRLKWWEVALDAAMIAFLIVNTVLGAQGHAFNAYVAGFIGLAMSLAFWFQGRTVEIRGQIDWMKRTQL